MPTIDPGLTTFDDLGRATLSPQAIKLPIPMQNPIAPTPQSLGQTPQTGPVSLQKQGDPKLLPTYSKPTDRYQAIESNEMPNPNDPSLQHHGMAKLGDIIGAAPFGPFAPLVYHALHQLPYREAEQNWENKLGVIKPEIDTELAQNRSADENKRFETSQASLDKSRADIEDNRKQKEAETTLKDLEAQKQHDIAAKAEVRKEELRKALADQAEKVRVNELEQQNKFRDRELEIRNQELKLQKERLNREAADKGTWVPAIDKQGVEFLFNNKTKEKDYKAAEGGINKPSDVRADANIVAKKEEKLAPLKRAWTVANDYVKSGKFTGEGDLDLILKYFEMARTQGLRINNAELDRAFKARNWKEGIETIFKHGTDSVYLGDKERQDVLDVINREAKAAGINAPATPKIQRPGAVIIHWPGEK